MNKMNSSIIIPKDNKYKTCDTWNPIFNTLYIYFGIPILVIIIIVFLIFIIIIINKLVNPSNDLFDLINTPLISISLLCMSIIPILLTYKHIVSIKKTCYNKE